MAVFIENSSWSGLFHINIENIATWVIPVKNFSHYNLISQAHRKILCTNDYTFLRLWNIITSKWRVRKRSRMKTNSIATFETKSKTKYANRISKYITFLEKIHVLFRNTRLFMSVEYIKSFLWCTHNLN